MIQLNALILLALANPGEPGFSNQPTRQRSASPTQIELLEFTADWCSACRTMEPTIERMRRDGYPIQRIDVDQRRDLARRFGVTQLPQSVIVANGRVVSRKRGAATYGELTNWFRQHQARISPEQLTVRGQSPRRSRDQAGNPAADGQFARNASAVNGRRAGATPTDARRDVPTSQRVGPSDRAMQATVRLKVEDARGYSYGTGTIIDTHEDEALVITCGHIFRESQGRGLITVDLNVPGAEAVRGELISWDAGKRDIAVLSIRPGVRVTPVAISRDPTQVFRGNAIFSIGCNKGQPATIQRSRIASVDRYGGPSNIEVKGQPVNGRSGGGLFNQAGELIGVCRAADPTDDEGIYVALPVVYQELDKIGQAQLYKRPARLAATHVPQQTLEQDTRPPAASRLSRRQGPSGEVICIIRDENGQSRTIMIPRPSTELVRQIERAGDDQQAIATRPRSNLTVRGQDE